MQTKTGVHYIDVKQDQLGQRIDNFLHTRYKDLPKSRLYRLLRKGEIRVNKKRIDPDYRLADGDTIRMPPLLRETEPQTSAQTRISPQLNKLLKNRILYEDKGLLILNKPAGMAVHGGSGLKFGVIEALRAMRPNDSYLELVHRLDRETSGCLLLAKKPAVLRECHQLLRESKMAKYYFALVRGHWPAHLKSIQQPLYKNHLSSGERIVRVDEHGKPSKTLFTIKQYYSRTTLLEIRPETGRTHQIRVHTAHAGFHVVGDDKYGDAKFNQLMRTYGCERLFLHAARLKFTLTTALPLEVDVTAPFDDDLTNCLHRLANND